MVRGLRRASPRERTRVTARSGLRVLYLAAEAAPFVKVGGLGDVAAALPLQLRKMGLDLRLALPLYPQLQSLIQGKSPSARCSILTSAEPMTALGYEIRLEGLPICLVDGDPIRHTDAVYHDLPREDASKFLFFSLAALELSRVLGWPPDVVHANDWHTAAAIYWLGVRGKQTSFWARAATVLTIHNLPYLGNGLGEGLALYGLPAGREVAGSLDNQLPEWTAEAVLPLALSCADVITTVSPSYASEIQTPEFGCGLDSFFRSRSDRLLGILNGLDLDKWNPATDPDVPMPFDADHLDRRQKNRWGLRRELDLGGEGCEPMVGIVSRLDAQKGLDLAVPALEAWVRSKGHVVVLGTGDRSLEEAYRALAQRYPDQVAAEVGYDSRRASQIYAGADLFLMPSRYEPCGLGQMIAMRYGCPPVVRATGGLRDTVRDVSSPRGTGFVFDLASSDAIWEGLCRARESLTSPEHWRRLQRNGMQQDYGWSRPARAYLKAYRRAIRFHRQGAARAEEGR
jgi:starch synthase